MPTARGPRHYKGIHVTEVAKPERGDPELASRSLGLTASPSFLRSTQITDHASCPRLFLFRHRFGLTPLSYVSAPTVGTVFHTIKAGLWSGKSQQQVEHLAATAWTDFEQRLQARVGNSGLLPWGASYDSVIQRASKDFSIGRALALWSWQAYGAEQQFKIWQPIAVERQLTIRLKGFGASLRVQLDVLLINRKDGTLWIMDHKTTGRDTLARMATLGFEVQPRLYRLATALWLSSPGMRSSIGLPDDPFVHPLTGWLCDIVQKPAIRQKQAETFDEFLDRIGKTMNAKQVDFSAGRLGDSGPAALLRSLKFRGPSLDAELKSILFRVSRAGRRLGLPLELYPRTGSETGACYKWNTPCAFLPLCTRDPAAWSQELYRYEVNFRDDPSTPDED
jgi:hypothetical protein